MKSSTFLKMHIPMAYCSMWTALRILKLPTQKDHKKKCGATLCPGCSAGRNWKIYTEVRGMVTSLLGERIAFVVHYGAFDLFHRKNTKKAMAVQDHLAEVEKRRAELAAKLRSLPGIAAPILVPHFNRPIPEQIGLHDHILITVSEGAKASEVAKAVRSLLATMKLTPKFDTREIDALSWLSYVLLKHTPVTLEKVESKKEEIKLLEADLGLLQRLQDLVVLPLEDARKLSGKRPFKLLGTLKSGAYAPKVQKYARAKARTLLLDVEIAQVVGMKPKLAAMNDVDLDWRCLNKEHYLTLPATLLWDRCPTCRVVNERLASLHVKCWKCQAEFRPKPFFPRGNRTKKKSAA